MKTLEENAPATSFPVDQVETDQAAEVSVEQPGVNESEEEGQLTIDVYQTEDDVVLLSTIAGVKVLDLEITLNNDLLTIKGARSNPATDIKAEDFYYQENYWGKFSRSVILPVDVEANKVRAELKDGILKVLLPKAIRAKTKRIKVTNGK